MTWVSHQISLLLEGSTKKPQKELVADAISGAATNATRALGTPDVNSLSNSKIRTEPDFNRTPITNISPGKTE